MTISRTAALSPQCQEIYQHMRRGGSLTQLEAYRPPFNSTRLSERAREIAAYLGIEELHKVREFHNGKHYTRYSLPVEYLPNRVSVNDYLNEQVRLFA